MGTAASALLVRVAGLETVGCVQDFRKTRERLTEVEEDLRLRVADLMAELDAERLVNHSHESLEIGYL